MSNKLYVIRYEDYDEMYTILVYASSPADAVEKVTSGDWEGNNPIPPENIANVYEQCDKKTWYRGW